MMGAKRWKKEAEQDKAVKLNRLVMGGRKGNEEKLKG